MIRRELRVMQPANGWPPAPCHRWTTDHPAHGWIGPVSGRLYWCGPKARAWAAALTEEAADARMAQDLRYERQGDDHG